MKRSWATFGYCCCDSLGWTCCATSAAEPGSAGTWPASSQMKNYCHCSSPKRRRPTHGNDSRAAAAVAVDH